jgi:hypothetical protein
VLLNIFLFPIFVYILSIFGNFFKNTFKIKVKDYLFIDLIFGFFFITLILFLLNFIVNLKSYLVCIIFLILFIFAIKKFFLINYNKLKKYIFIILAVSSFSGIMEIGYDSNLYHIPFQAWLQDEKIIIGMANLNFRFGLSSIYSYISAVLWFDDIFLFVSYLAAIFYLIFFLFIIEFLSTSHTKIAYALILIITFPLWSRYSLYTHSLIDVPFGIFSIILITLIFFNHQSWFKKGKDNNYDLYLLSILFFLLFTIKSSGILFFPLLILLIWSFYKKQKIKPLYIPTLIFLFLFFLWTLRHFLITGCFYYPITFTCANVDWLNIDNLNYVNIGITEYAKAPLKAVNFTENLFNYYSNIIILIILIVLLFFAAKKYKKKFLNFINLKKINFFIILTLVYFINLYLLNDLKGLSLLLEQKKFHLLQKIIYKEIGSISIFFFISFCFLLIIFNKDIIFNKLKKIDFKVYCLIFVFFLLLMWLNIAPQPRFAYGFIPLLVPLIFFNLFSVKSKVNLINIKNKMIFLIYFIILFTVFKNFPEKSKLLYNLHINEKISHVGTKFTYDSRETFGVRPNFQDLCSNEKKCYLGNDRVVEDLKFNYKKIK